MSSYENILNRMLDNISVDIDKREGSFVHGFSYSNGISKSIYRTAGPSKYGFR